MPGTKLPKNNNIVSAVIYCIINGALGKNRPGVFYATKTKQDSNIGDYAVDIRAAKSPGYIQSAIKSPAGR
jgi:hypothetical protein